MYIRTKNRIYQVESTLKDNGFLKGYNVGEMAFITKDQVINQSENLDELCDGFYIDEGNEFSFYKENAYEDFEEAKEVFKKEFDDTSTLYGFIKTRKGLIYIAKMNSDPILKLF